MARYGYWRLRQIAVPLMALSLALLLAVWLPHIGVRENNASRWLKFGPVQFQPSELAKMALILYISALLSRPHCRIRTVGDGIGPPLFVTMITVVLIEREPDLGTAVVLFLAVVTVLYLAGARKRHLVTVLAAAGLAVILLGLGQGHRQGRIWEFLHPGKDKEGIGYQIFHSRLAIGSGEVLGVGLGHGREKYYLPQSESDFVFATLAEELGFLWTVPVLGLLCLVGWRGMRIAWGTRDRFGSLLAGGIAALISWQALINIAVATGSIPATGVPLPFISYGSTSMVLLLAGVGILLNIAQHPTPPGQDEPAGA
jgi:cell division protein FtsW